jgi:hypothetical protein
MSKYGFFPNEKLMYVALDKLLLQLQSTFNVFTCMSGVWHITVEWKIVDKFSKMLYQKNENVLWRARYIKVSILFI